MVRGEERKVRWCKHNDKGGLGTRCAGGFKNYTSDAASKVSGRRKGNAHYVSVSTTNRKDARGKGKIWGKVGRQHR